MRIPFRKEDLSVPVNEGEVHIRMARIYIAFVDTPGLFAGLIRKVINQKYIHVAIGLDPYLDEAYSIGRRHPSVPFFAGFEREDKTRILRAFPGADYMVCRIECSREQKEFVEQRLRADLHRRFRYHYTILGLPFILMGKPFFQKNHYTCSSYAAKLLGEAGICNFDKHFSLVTPRDFYEYPGKETIFEGRLFELVKKSEKVESFQEKQVSGKYFAAACTKSIGCIKDMLKWGISYER